MPEMSFMLSLSDFLKNNGKIYTVRTYWYGYESWARVPGLGKVKRVFIKEIDGIKDLEEFVKSSGFYKIEDWWEKINYFIHDKNKKYLYEVTIV